MSPVPNRALPGRARGEGAARAALTWLTGQVIAHLWIGALAAASGVSRLLAGGTPPRSARAEGVRRGATLPGRPRRELALRAAWVRARSVPRRH